MTNQDNHDREQDLRERIASRIESDGLVPRKELPTEELQRLRSAATRLDQMLKAAVDTEHQALQTAAARLDQLLADIGTGKDVTPTLKRRPGQQTPKD